LTTEFAVTTDSANELPSSTKKSTTMTTKIVEKEIVSTLDNDVIDRTSARPKIEITTTAHPKINVHSDENDEVEFVEVVFEKLLQEEDSDVEIIEAGSFPIAFSFALLSILLF